MVRFQSGAQATAIFSSGAKMTLSYRVENNTLFVTQASRNAEGYYHPLPQGVARELAARAEPIRWELSLYDNGSSLKGVRIETGARYSGDTLTEIVPGFVKPVEWTKLSR